MKYLDKNQIETNLKTGKAIEQWIGHYQESDYTILQWLRIDKERSNEFSVSYFEVFDDGDKEFLDIYSFSSADANEPYGRINSFENFQIALYFAEKFYAASIARYVNAGMIQDEYQSYVESKGTSS